MRLPGTFKTLLLDGPNHKAGHLFGLQGELYLFPRDNILNSLSSDPTGFSFHGDFQNGWDITALQNAIDKCNNKNDATGQGDTAACSYLNVISASQANTCKLNPVFSEQTGGNLTYLPG
jgi:hypothetical protein